ncbi:uncharacterized protein ACLA_068700 [Aspergillus clavatus NRRL 1]|uniref:p-hydroxylaminobenzoate lyase n=1 Tax=Aspergillus clavatus (strain ATCC 1007 / CBS 513.65 / DSM 816 / NCTC 3887 / NRRL 1 / QM 1276 / 107) TaxID=344612 RepID=A1C621_ASPCL|nr:uncharacterized protein ACLA_068700 [Aspergillus clavatus NRRL 1]EAW13842.1 conserved hypothetical protein [Aspergillus clavatus NRRL 1]
MTQIVHPNKQKLIDRAGEFLTEVEDLTPGLALEKYLNEHYGPGTPYYEDFCTLIRNALTHTEGWVATTEIDGPHYRRSRVSDPSADTRYFSITTVYMDSQRQEVFRGQYHRHPYGEINCVVQIDESAELMGMSGWQGAGWTSPGPGTHHYPEARGGGWWRCSSCRRGGSRMRRGRGMRNRLVFRSPTVNEYQSIH